MQRPRRQGARSRAVEGSLSLLRTLNGRSTTGRPRGVEHWAEDESVFRHKLEYLHLSQAEAPTISTIAIAFSTDGKLFASTHGDHTVKITSFLRGKVVQTLRGHPRTPWTVKFHPNDSRIVASGCIGDEVRVWNTSTGHCLHAATLQGPIISLSFHPSGRMLAMASSLYVYLWDYNNKKRPYIAWAHSHTLRCVRFTPGGNSIIVSAANSSSAPPSTQNRNQNQYQRGPAPAGEGAGAATSTAPRPTPAPPQPAEVTFRLQVWDFNLEAALAEHIASAMTRERVILGQALLYGDGGFDVSQDGLWLCAIARLRGTKAGGSRPTQGGQAIPVPADASRQGPAPASAAASAAASAPRLLSSASAAAMATVMEVEEGEDEDGEGGERKDAAASGAPAGELTTEGAGGPRPDAEGGMSAGGLILAPKNGSQLDSSAQPTPLAATGVKLASALAAAGLPLAATAGSLVEAAGGKSGHNEVSSATAAEARGGGMREERWRGTVLAPWPSRARERPYFSDAFAGERPEKGREAAAAATTAAAGTGTITGGVSGAGAGASAGAAGGDGDGGAAAGGSAATATAAATVRPEDAKNEPPPFTPPPLTPSPRITLKRRLSGSWMSAVGGGRSSGGGSGGFWGRELRRGGSPRPGSAGGGGGGGREGGAVQQRGGRPPPLPPPPPPTAPVRRLLSTSPPAPFSTTATASPSLDTATAQVRQSLPPSPALPAAAGNTPPAPSAPPSCSSSLSGGLRITLPLLLPPPPRPSEGRIDTGVNAGIPVSAEDLEPGGTAEQQLVPPQPSQPVFFLQVPGGGSAAAAAAAAGVPAASLRQGEGWSSQYLSADTGADAARAAPITYGRDRVGGVGDSTGRGGRQEGARSAAFDMRGSGGVWGSDIQAGGNDALGGGGGGGGGSSSRAPPSFGRARRRGLPSSYSSQSLPLPPPPPPPGKAVPHLVLMSLNLEGERVGGGGGGGVEGEVRVVRAEAMDTIKAKQVTSIKLSPSARYILLGTGVRGNGQGAGGQAAQQAASRQGAASAASDPPQQQHPRTYFYRSADLQPVSCMPTGEEDLNIACFHPEPGMGCVYGTKQGRIGLVRMAD